MMKKIILGFVLMWLFILPVSAEEAHEDFYKSQYEQSGAAALSEHLPRETREFLKENGIDLENPDWTTAISGENVFSHIWSFLKSGALKPFSVGTAILAIILISAALSGMEAASGVGSVTLYVTALSTAAVISVPVFSVISSSVDAMQGCAVFMTAFIPVFAVLIASSGGAVTSVAMSGLLLGATQVVSYISNFIVVPLTTGYMALSLASSVSPVLSRSGVAEGIKKISFWIMSLLTTVFVGILSIQTVVSASSDTLALKTAKFIVGSSVPLAGTALSEALTTVTASLGLLKSSVGVYGVVACVAIFLPFLAELLIWRVILVICSSVSDLFSLPKISGLLRSVDTVMSVIIGIIMLTCAMFVISLTVVMTVGRIK
ncbi:MAG: hypothetical protein E7560_00725 [Ruminococcaceae bacterium]|nr:hypothetical protein [Oscillospiraceae bacterium]